MSPPPMLGRRGGGRRFWFAITMVGAAVLWVGIACVGLGGEGGEVEFGWTVTVLHPEGADASRAYAVADGRASGFVELAGVRRAALWPEDGGDPIDLHPAASPGSQVHAATGGVQVGVAVVGADEHASLWLGTAECWTDLNPPTASSSEAVDVAGGVQVGSATFAGTTHAGVWLEWERGLLAEPAPAGRDRLASVRERRRVAGGVRRGRRHDGGEPLEREVRQLGQPAPVRYPRLGGAGHPR